MHSSENNRRSQRRRPDLNIDTSPKSSSLPKSREPAPPQTPPPSRSKPPPSLTNKAKPPLVGSRALRVPTSSTRNVQESFLDNPTPVDAAADMSNKENNHPEYGRPRDSHDLSLPARQVTRDSLMANMLFSLDQFSMGGQPANGPQYGSGRANTFDVSPQMYPYDADGDGMARTMTTTTRPGRSNSHTHGYSYSSDFDAADDSSRISSQISRGRRSNSSSNFQPNLGRINSMRESVRSTPGTPRHMHSGGGKGSNKSSSSNSIDAGYVQVTGTQRWAQGFGGRSASFDHGHRPPLAQQASHQSGWHIEFSNNFFSEDYEAAPTPTIPGGPRRQQTPITNPATTFPPPPEPSAPKSPGLDRKRSTRSAKSITGRKAESKFGGSAREAMPQAIAPEMDSAPAPHVGYEKSKEAVHGGPTSTQTSSQTKDRPGFFKRVFGSSRNNLSGNIPDSQTTSGVLSSTSVNTMDRPGSRPQHLASQMKSQSSPPSRDTSSSHSHHHVLQKKPSSFFRRRKKSVTDNVPPVPTAVDLEPPMPPLVAPIQLPITKDRLSAHLSEPSPVSSLRQVMNPYLKGSPVTPITPHPFQSPPIENIESKPPPEIIPEPEVREYKRDFSPDYEPSPNAMIRAVRPGSASEELSSSERERRTDTPTRPPPEVPKPSEKRNNSFLNLDASSDNEAESGSTTNTMQERGRSPRQETSLSTSPNASSPTDKTGGTIRGKKMSRPTIDQADLLVLPMEGTRSTSMASGSTGSGYRSASSGSPSIRAGGSGGTSPKVLGTFESVNAKPLDEPDFVVGDPTEDDRNKAQKIFDGNEDFIQREKAAAWMGEEGLVRQRTLTAYMELYDFKNKSVVNGLREICGRLVFRAETQQVDRILVAFSARWCDCNPNHGFKAPDVIHTVCYSVMLLNTDLHLADIEQKMTRSQFVKNTMTTIVQAAEDAVPDAFERPSILPGKNQGLGIDDAQPSTEERSNRMSFIPPLKNHFGLDHSNPDDICGPLVKAPFSGSMKQWEGQVELVLKDIYASIRDERLPLFGAEPDRNASGANSQNNLSVMGMLKRSPSVLSKAPSEGQTSIRGRITDTARAGTSRWTSKSRSRPRMGAAGFSSSRTSFDDNNSIWSPTASSANWSRYSLGRTQTSMSMDSFGGASGPKGDYQQSIGFANALSQSIIRDDIPGFGSAPSILSDEIKATQLLEDESLELAGPPWVKEGMVVHKHHLDGVDKKAKDRNWGEVFAVIQKGHMSLFSFSTSKSQRHKGRSARNAVKNATPVGGGNWQENATNLGTFSLRQTLASALPPPGYSRTRPHVWALSLPTGAVHLFQVGTPEITKEFVTTANYWSARLSTHPLVGGISNIEYGWSDGIVNNALVTAINDTAAGRPPSSRTSRPGSSAAPGTGGRASIQSGSYRSSSFDHGIGGVYTSGGRGSKLPGDRIHIAEWSPPTQSLRPSNMVEHEQLQTLLAYVKGIEEELQVHNQLRSPMLLAFTPRGHNVGRAMANWERKSSYLLREIVKFRTYVDCLQQAESRKAEIYEERDHARRAARGELSDGEMEGSGDEEGDVTLQP